MEKNFDWNDAVKLTRAYLQIREETLAKSAACTALVVGKFGAGEGARTLDLKLGKLAL